MENLDFYAHRLTKTIQEPGLRMQQSAGFITFFVDRKSTRLNSSHANISYAVFCLKKKIHTTQMTRSTSTYQFMYCTSCKVGTATDQTSSRPLTPQYSAA